MKKVINGSVYNTETAKWICERISDELNHEKGAGVKTLKQLYKTKSDKFFFYINNKFLTYVDVSNDDLNPKFEEQEVVEEKIVEASYELALQFASEAIQNSNSDNDIGRIFPELAKEKDGDTKTQKKFYISIKADWYLEMMLKEEEDTNSSFIEKLIIAEYKRQFKKGDVNRDPFHEMED
ncbi:hypothetical protein EPH95_14905 [Salicibibacter halophilus]|uniref:Uncharacterized protein n=1 Tax=Salicibibacter halophilus TaxID=2502791 RepID=A0A514LM43_9BACI|nr:hypothetical protein [Salicibibacter halophilus]QDI92321.1 hypothetical protein EPH95_14905 [Salicibibacter halophilus]